MLYHLKSFSRMYHPILLSIIILLLTSCSSSVGWHRLEIQNHPQAVTSAAVAYNSKIQKAILFGGMNSVLVDNAWKMKWSDDTWEWNGEDWKKLSPAHVPPARSQHVMTYDEARDRIVLFGGSADKLLFNDTWEWDGADWKLVKPKHNPPARCCHAMAYDSQQKQVVLYGGWDAQHNTFFNDVWIWDGKDWTNKLSRAPEMSGHFLVDFPPTGEIFSVQTSNLGTWKWDGRQFVDLGVESPPTRQDVRVVYDADNERLVLFGGMYDKKYLADTWVFDGKVWFQVRLPDFPSPRFGQVMFYDQKRNSIILTGGQQEKDPYYMNDTWELLLPEDLSEFKQLTLTAIPNPKAP